MKNRYFAMRHGQSEANAARIIASDPAVCLQGFGLTPSGAAQVTASVKGCLHEFGQVFGQDTLIISSDFLRARQTAQIVADLQPAGIRELIPFGCTQTKMRA